MKQGRMGSAWRGRVQVPMRNAESLSQEQIREFLQSSAAQMTRLIRAFLDHGVVRAALYQRHRFRTRYTAEDIALLAEVDRAHERLSGPATRRILQREYERRRPDPHGRPGFLRVDTGHQGAQEGAKGVYHINAVDTVTQWQVVGCTSKISEAYLLQVLEAVLAQFPITVLGFPVDKGSEYINHRGAKMLERLHAEFTKSRACRSQDNALVEGKNGAVVRKLMG